MNLHGLVSPLINTINPSIQITIRASDGSTYADDGTRVPAYLPPVTVTAQVQNLTYGDLAFLDGLNIQGDRKALYMNGNWQGVVRPDGRGGDLITFPDGSVWLVVQVLEDWESTSGWSKLAITRQNGS